MLVAKQAKQGKKVRIASPVRFDFNFDGVTVGHAIVDESDRKEIYLDWFKIEPIHQHKGFGFSALLELCDYYRQRGAKSITLMVLPGNKKAIGLYRKAGFYSLGIEMRKRL